MLTVLLVDDEERIRRGIAGAMDWAAVNCVLIDTASDGIEALEIYYRKRPECVITDIRMPRMNGLKLIRRIRELDEDCELIILTGYEEFEIAREAMSWGVKHYILKPFDEEELTRVLQKINASRRRGAGRGAGRGAARDTAHPDVNRVITAIHNNCRRKDLSLGWIVEHIVFKNRDYLGKIFRDFTGKSFNRALNDFRIDRAEALLRRDPSVPLEVLTEETGYAADGRYLSRQFRRRTGMSIGEYRRRVIRGDS